MGEDLLEMNVDKIKGKFAMEYQLYKKFYRKSMFTVLILGILTAFAFFFASFYFEDFIVQQTNSIAEQMLDEKKGRTNEFTKVFFRFY